MDLALTCQRAPGTFAIVEATTSAPGGKRAMSVVRYLRAAVAVLVVTITSGVPRAAAALLADDCCLEQCDGERGGESCPPECTSITCVKVVVSAVAPSSGSDPLMVEGRDALPASGRPVLPLVTGGVFQPPRR
jgi:hypothetical protein